jgi:IclR family transcriptional regulator, acetate operon repressor
MARTANPNIKMKNVRAVERAIEILEAFTKTKPSMSVLEIQKEVGLSRPTLYRLLETLASKGLIRADGTPQRFSLDYGVGRLAQSWLSGLDPTAAARLILERLHEETKETVALMTVRDQQSLCILELPSPHVLTVSRGIGPMGHIARGATGKAILAFMGDKAIEAALGTLPKDIDKALLLKDLAQIRHDKFRISRGEVFAGAVSIAAPYFDHLRAVAGSIGIFAPEARVTEDWIGRTTRRVTGASAELSTALGYNSSGARPKLMSQLGGKVR